MTDGESFRARGRHGTFIYRGMNKDGSIRAYGGTKFHQQWCDIRPDDVRQNKKRQQTDNQVTLFG